MIDLALTYWVGYPDWLSAIRGRRLLEDDACPDWLYLEEQRLAYVHQCALEALVAAAEVAQVPSDAIYESGQWCRRLCPSQIQWPSNMASTSAPAEVLAIFDGGFHQLLRLTNRAALPAALPKASKPQGGGPRSEPEWPSKEALALAVLADHPDWSDTQIAKKAGCNRTTLYTFKKFMAAREILREGKSDLPRGSKYPDEGVEAWDNEDDN